MTKIKCRLLGHQWYSYRLNMDIKNLWAGSKPLMTKLDIRCKRCGRKF